jgi:hypothetical protein
MDVQKSRGEGRQKKFANCAKIIDEIFAGFGVFSYLCIVKGKAETG